MEATLKEAVETLNRITYENLELLYEERCKSLAMRLEQEAFAKELRQHCQAMRQYLERIEALADTLIANDNHI
jgi:hypothetical protein